MIKEFKMQVSSLNTQAVNSYTQNNKKSFEAENVKPDLSLNSRIVSMMFASGDNATPNALAQSSLSNMVENDQGIKDFLMGLESEGTFSLSDLGYEGKAILELSPDEASDLLGEGGFFSVENTAGRAVDFVLGTAGDDLSMLKAGREGIVKGFTDAEKAWGGTLPDIAYETQSLTLEKIDAKIQSLGGNALDVAA